MSHRNPYHTYLNEKGELDKSTFKKLFKAYKGCDFGTILCGCDDLNKRKLKTDFVRNDYSVTEILVTTIPENDIVTCFIITSFHKNLKEFMIQLAEKYNQDYITYFNRESFKYYLIDNKTKTETELGDSMFTEKGYFNYAVPRNRFKFKDFIYGHAKVDCTKSVYGFNAVMCMCRFDDYVVSE